MFLCMHVRGISAAPSRRIIRHHVIDNARRQLAERIDQHLEQSGFELNEEGQALRKGPPTHAQLIGRATVGEKSPFCGV